MLHTYFIAVCIIEAELLAMGFSICGEAKLSSHTFLRCGNMHCRLFCSCDLDLDPMTFIYKYGVYSLELHRMCKYELSTSSFESYRLTDRQTYIQTSAEIINHAAKVERSKIAVHRLGDNSDFQRILSDVRHYVSRQLSHHPLCAY